MSGLDCRIGKSYGEQLQGHLLRETGVGGLLRFRPTILLLWAVVLALFAATPLALSAELPLSVTPSVANPGQTVTVTGQGFQSGARGLVWGGGPYIRGSVATPGYARGVVLSGGYAYVADGSSGL